MERTESENKFKVLAQDVRLEHIIALAISNGVKPEALREYLKTYGYSETQIEALLNKIKRQIEEA